MKGLLKISFSGLVILITATACSRKIYHPPALGAEYQFDRGLPAAKKTSQLFGKKMEKDLTKKGVFQKQQSPTVITKKRGSSTSHSVADSTKTNPQALPDSTKTNKK